MTVYPIAKINLGLNVVSKRADGYHDLQTVFYPVPLKDKLVCEASSEVYGLRSVDCELHVSGIEVPGDTQNNLVVRAYEMLKADFPTLPRIQAHLWKGIPTQAGMGGGSSDGAYMLRLLNDMFELHLSRSQLIDYAARLGADCAFFILSAPCYAEGIGERLQPVAVNLQGWHLGVVRPDIPVPTKEAFSLIHPHQPAKNCREVVETQPVATWRTDLVNDFEASVFAQHPELAAIKARLYDFGATYAAMSGSGSALFGLFQESPVTLADAFPDMFTAQFSL